MQINSKKVIGLILALVLIGLALYWVPRKRPITSYTRRAQEAFQNKRFRRAVELNLKALKYYPDHEVAPKILLSIGDTYNFSMGDTEKAGQAYEMLAQRFPKTVESRQGLQNSGEMYEKTQQYQKALLAYQTIVDNFPEAGDIDEIRFKVAVMALKLKKFEPARRSLMAIIENNPETPIADRTLYQLGSIFFIEGAPKEAEEVLKVALEKFPNSPLKIEMEFTLGNAYEEQGKLDQALEIYKKIQKEYPNPMVIQNKIDNILNRQAPRSKGKKSTLKTKASP